MYFGLAQLKGESERFPKMRPFCVIMSVYCIITYVSDIFGLVDTSDEVVLYVTTAFGIIYSIVMAYIIYNIIMGIVDIENRSGADLESQTLKTAWIVLTVLNIVLHLCVFIPIPWVLIAGVCINFIVGFGFIYRFSKTYKAYEALDRGGEENVPSDE